MGSCTKGRWRSWGSHSHNVKFDNLDHHARYWSKNECSCIVCLREIWGFRPHQVDGGSRCRNNAKYLRRIRYHFYRCRCRIAQKVHWNHFGERPFKQDWNHYNRRRYSTLRPTPHTFSVWKVRRVQPLVSELLGRSWFVVAAGGLVVDMPESGPNQSQASNFYHDVSRYPNPPAMREFNDYVLNEPRLEVVVLPMCNGVGLIRLKD